MDGGFVTSVAAWVGMAIAVVGLAVSILAYRHSKLVQRVAIPAPEAVIVRHGIVRLAMRPEDAPRFAIARVRYGNQRIQRVVALDRLDGMARVRSYGNLAEPSDSIELHPPLTEVLVTIEMLLARDIYALVVSRAAPSISAWIVIKVAPDHAAPTVEL